MHITPAVPDPPEIQSILWAGFSKTDVAFDVGANCGQTFHHIRRFSEKLVAFEPAVEAFSYLDRHYGWKRDIERSQYAVSDVDGDIELVAAEDKISTGQLVTAGTTGMEWSDSVDGAPVRSLPAITLDTYAFLADQWPGFIKIDVEGHELRVLQGARRILTTGPEMLIEVHSEQLGRDIHSLLSPDYRIELVRHPHYVPDSDLWKAHFWYRCFPPRSIY